MEQEKKGELIEALKAGYTLSDACRVAGVGRTTVWRWRQVDPELDEAIQFVMDDQDDQVEAVTFRNALDPDPAHNTLRMFWLKSRRRETYGERSQLDVATSEPLQVEHTHTGDAKVDVDAAAVVSVLQNAGLIIVGRDRQVDHSSGRADGQDSLCGPGPDGSSDGVPDAGLA